MFLCRIWQHFRTGILKRGKSCLLPGYPPGRNSYQGTRVGIPTHPEVVLTPAWCEQVRKPKFEIGTIIGGNFKFGPF
eukprot:1252203-Rhodomonas_salina.1